MTPTPPPFPGAERTTGRPWAVGHPLVWSTGAAVVLLVIGALAGRPDVALLGLAPALASVVALRSRPRGQVWADVVPGPPPEPGQAADTVVAEVLLTAPPGTEAVRVRLARPGHGMAEALVDVPLTRTLEARAVSVRTGPQELFRVQTQGIGGGSALTGEVAEAVPGRVLVLPRPLPLPALPLPTRLRGLTGQHESRRPGEGGGLRDVHPFASGDQPRRVDWKVTARRSPGLEQLYVRRTTGMAEAVVTLVVDSRDDVGPDPHTWAGTHLVRPDESTSLDLAREAAATVAQGYVAVGDRVGVEDLGVRRRTLRAGTGRRQLDRVVQQLALLAPEGNPPTRLRAPRIPPGALVYVFSTFLDSEATDLVIGWRRAGHRVVAVDVLPRVREAGLTAREWLALRVVRLRREDRLAEVERAGAEVVTWADPQARGRWAVLARAGRRHRPGRS